MATKVLVNGKFVTRPGVYATIQSGVKNPPQNLPYGNILIIDDGLGAGFGGGGGINGQITNGLNAAYSFSTIQDYQAFVKGGELWNLGFPLFNPSGSNAGISKVTLIRAATTAPAQLVFTLTNGAFVIKTIDEGLNANGVLDSSNNLSTGYAAKLVQVNIPTVVATFTTSTLTAPSSGVSQVNKVVASLINVGDVFTYTQASVTITKTAATTLPADLYAQFVTAINANSTLSPIVTASSSGAGLIITADVANTAFTSTSTATPGPTKYQLNFYHGTFKGIDPLNTTPYGGTLSVNAIPQLVLQSPVVSAVSDLIAWFNSSSDFAAAFKLISSSATGNIVAGDLVTYPGYNLATGGTESYGSADFDSALASINNLDYSFILATSYGANATGLNNTKIFGFINPTGTSKYERFMVVGGGFDSSAFSSGTGSSGATAAYYNSDRVIVVHGGCKKTSTTSTSGFNVYSQLYKAAALLGRLCGLEPQVPLTLKTIGIDADVHALSDTDQETAISLGILYTYFDYELNTFVAGLDVNSLQNNQFLVNDDGTTFNIAIKRIEAYLNKSIVFAAKQRFFGGNTGPNRNTVSADDVTAWLQTYLLTKTASSLQDNLILGFQNIVVTTQQDNLFASYQFFPNSEISKLIFTGILLEQ